MRTCLHWGQLGLSHIHFLESSNSARKPIFLHGCFFQEPARSAPWCLRKLNPTEQRLQKWLQVYIAGSQYDQALALDSKITPKG